MTTDGRIAVLTAALRRLERWGSCFCENSTISAETLWREFPRALKEARAALASTGTAESEVIAAAVDVVRHWQDYDLPQHSYNAATKCLDAAVTRYLASQGEPS